MDLKKRVGDRLREIIDGRPLLDLVDQDGPSLSYIYRILGGTANPSVGELDAILRAYNSNLAEFFEPWRDIERADRLRQGARIIESINQIIQNSSADLNGLEELSTQLLTSVSASKRSSRKRH